MQPASVWEAESNSTSAEIGAAVAGGGDVDRDGWGDLVVAAPERAEVKPRGGRIASFRGGAGWPPHTPDGVIDGSVSGERLGASVAGAGDLGGDGYADVLVGALATSVTNARETGDSGDTGESGESGDDGDTGDRAGAGCGGGSSQPTGAVGVLLGLGVALRRRAAARGELSRRSPPGSAPAGRRAPLSSRP